MSKFLVLLVIQLSLFSCSKIDLTDEDSKASKSSSMLVKDTLSIADVEQKEIGEIVGVKGYLVGYCTGTSLTTANDELPLVANTNFLLSDKPTLEVSERVLSVRLNKGNHFHEQWNLHSHPERLGTYVLVYGKLQNYFGIKGIKEPKKIEQLVTPQQIFPPKKDTILTVGDTLNILQFLKLEPLQYVTVRGYIVGTVRGTSLKQSVLGKADAEVTNILLALTPTTKELGQMIPIRLRTKSQERSQLDLYAHPELLGQFIAVSGIIRPYFGINGIKNVTSFSFLKEKREPSQDPNKNNPNITPPPVVPRISDSSAVIDGRARQMSF